MKISRLNYDKVARCPSWSGPGWRGYRTNRRGYCTASFASFMFERRAWRWRFTRCRTCGVTCLPYVTRWADPAWLSWRLGRTYREIHERKH